MTSPDHSVTADLPADRVAQLLDAPHFAILRAKGAPFVILDSGAQKFCAANSFALRLLDAPTLDDLNKQMQGASGTAQLARFISAIPAGTPPRLARFRLQTKLARGPVTFLCQHQSGGYMVAAALGFEAPADSAAPQSRPDHAAQPAADSESQVLPAPVMAPRQSRRFVWQSDAHDNLSALSAELADFTGAHHAPQPGEKFSPKSSGDDTSAAQSLAAAMARRATFSGIELFWPVGDGAQLVPLTLAGVPIFSRAREFAGYRGFGIIQAERIEAAPAPVILPVSETPSRLLADHFTTGAAPESEAPKAAESAMEAPSEPASPPPHKRNVVALRPNGVGPRAVPTEPVEVKPALTIVPRDRLGAPRAASESVSLSPGERNAFREIARALGARIRDGGEIENSRAGEAAPAAPEDIAPPALPLPVIAAGPPSPVADPAPVTRDAAPAHDDGFARNGAKMIDRIPVGLLVSRGNIPIFLNQTLLDLLGYHDADHFHEAGGMDKMFRGRLPEKLTAGVESGAIPIVGHDGEVIAVDARVQRIDWDDLPATLMTFRRSLDAEQGARIRALELDVRARESEARELHAILDTATDGVAVIDEKGIILALNRSGEALFGYDQNEVAGESMAMLFAPESQGFALEYLEGLKSSGVASVLNDGREITGRERQGGAIPIFMTLGRLGSGGTAKFCAVLRDQTQWKKAERELTEARKQAERASALKSDFLAKISHEIRTPLNAILGFAEVIMDERFGPVGNERYKDYLKDIHTSGNHVMSLVNDLLDLSKIEAGKLDLTFAAVDANKIIAECVSLMQPQSAKERVIMRMSLAPRLPNIVADERSLRQIVLNILSNAVKFNEAGGQVIISTALTDAGHAIIRVKDTGIGMSDAEVDVALEPFRQIHTSRRSGGTGLGLPLTKALAEANRASFSIKSKKSEGTLVEIAFPPTRVLAE